MRLLFIHQHLGAFGGAETNIHITASELSARGHHVALLYQRGTGRNETAWRDLFSPVIQLPPEAPERVVSVVLKDFEPELIYLHTLSELETLKVLADCGLPVVRMVHDHDLYCLRSYKYNCFTRKICTRPASAYCVFPCLAPLARRRGGWIPVRWASYRRKRNELRLNRRFEEFVVYSDYSRHELIRNGFPPEHIHTHVPLRCWGSNGKTSSFSEQNLLLYVGQIIRGKGVDVLLHALAKVKLPFECMLLGDGSHKKRCEAIRDQLGLAARVHFQGYVSSQQLEQYYLEATALTVSSVWPEPFGMVGPEAMRYGVPVIAFDAGGVREWLTDGENGYLVPWMDTAQFAARIEALLGDKALARQLGRRAMERVNREYDACLQVSRLENLFTRLVRRRTAAARNPALQAQPLPV